MSDEFASMTLNAGRFLLGGLFVFACIEHAFIWRSLVQIMSRRRVPAPFAVLTIGSIFQGVLGLSLMLGVIVPWACAGLIAFTIAATIMFLNFWDMDGADRIHARNAALVNIGLIGGLLIAAAQSIQ